MSILNNILDLSFQTITMERRPVENGGNPSPPDRVRVGIDLSMVQGVSDVNRADQELQNYFIRVFGVNDTDTARYFDFLCARQNEYLLAQQVRPGRLTFDDPTYVQYLQKTMGINVPINPNPVDENFSNRGKVSPYSMKLNDMLRPGQNNSSFAYSGRTAAENTRNISPNTFVWESAVVDLLPRDSEGRIIRRPVSSTLVGRIPRPVDPNGVEPRPGQGENIISNVDYGDTEETLTIQEEIQQRAAIQNLQRVFLPRVEFDLTNQLGVMPGEELEQLTFYVFIYKNRRFRNQPPALAMTLCNGMTLIRSANVAGQKTIWPPLGLLGTPPVRLPRVNPFDLNAYLQGSDTQISPDAGFVQSINFSLLDQTVDRFNSIYDKVYKSFSPTLLDEQPILRDSLGQNNHFTDLWFSKDSDENLRLAFGFDIVSYLAEHSYFPYLYRNEKTAVQLINGTGLMNNEKPSGCYDIKVRRRQYKTEGQIGNNQLGTIGRGMLDDPELVYPDVYLDQVTPLDLYVPGITSSGVANQLKFFEGKDIYREPAEEDEMQLIDQTPLGTFYYLCEGTVIDSSPALMRNVLRLLSNVKHEIRIMFENLVSSIPATNSQPRLGIVTDGRGLYDPRTRRLAVPLSRIARQDGTIYRDHLMDMVRVLEMILTDFTPATGFLPGGLVPEVSSQLDINGGLIDPEYFLELERVVDFSTSFFYKKLYEIFPTDPFGREPANSRSAPIQSRGYQTKLPIYLFQHRFETSHFQGSGLKSGQDFMMITEPPQEKPGLTRFSYSDYMDRCRTEFKKYFDPTNDQPLDMFAPGYADSSYRYFTPLIVRTPNQETINQPQQATGDGIFLGAPYDLNVYAKLFADKVELNLEGKYLNRENPQIINNTNENPNENLFSSVKSTLWKHFATHLGQKIIPQFEEPRVSSGPYNPTVLRTGASSFDWSGVLAIPALVGGESLTAGTGYRYIQDANLNWASVYQSQKGKPKPKPPKGIVRRDLPIKLPFAIFGEMSIDPQMHTLGPTYLKESINSLTRAANLLTTPRDIAGQIDNFPLSGLPNQTKSLLVVATVNAQPTILGAGASQFDAKRPFLIDDDNSPMEDFMISYLRSNLDEFPLPTTLDPMKIYAKFMTFWMNYKNIFILEYLSGFGELNKNLIKDDDASQVGSTDSIMINKPKLPEWQPMSQIFFTSISKTPRKVLCRLRRLSPRDMMPIFDQFENEESREVLEQYFRSDVGFDFPVYNQYFILQQDPEPLPTIEEDIPPPGIAVFDIPADPEPEAAFPPQIVWSPPPPLPLLDLAIAVANNTGNESYALKGETSSTLEHLHHYNVDDDGNGWTHTSEQMEEGIGPHRHEVRNFIVQPALDHTHTLQVIEEAERNNRRDNPNRRTLPQNTRPGSFSTPDLYNRRGQS